MRYTGLKLLDTLRFFYGKSLVVGPFVAFIVYYQEPYVVRQRRLLGDEDSTSAWQQADGEK